MEDGGVQRGNEHYLVMQRVSVNETEALERAWESNSLLYLENRGSGGPRSVCVTSLLYPYSPHDGLRSHRTSKLH